MMQRFYFLQIKSHFAELYYLYLQIKGRSTQEHFVLPLFNIVQFFLVLREFILTQQQTFFTTALTNYVTKSLLMKGNAQMYADRRSLLWGLSNQRIFNAKLVAKGIEAQFDRMSGLVINTSLLFTARLPFRYLRNSDNALASVNFVPGIDYPLYIQPISSSIESKLLTFLQKLVAKTYNTSRFMQLSIQFPRLVRAISVCREKRAKRRPKYNKFLKKRP